MVATTFLSCAGFGLPENKCALCLVARARMADLQTTPLTPYSTGHRQKQVTNLTPGVNAGEGNGGALVMGGGGVLVLKLLLTLFYIDIE